MSRKPRAVEQPTLTPSPSHPVTVSPPQGLMLAWLAALFAARWLMPTEGAAEGLTLWLVQLVLFTAVVRAAWEWRCGEQRLRFDVMDAAIGLLILAQVVSALRVVFGVGDARAAINIAWEWVGSGVLIWMLRQELSSLRVARQLCCGLALAAGVLAGFGLWQHYVGYDEMRSEYDRLTSEHDRQSERQRGDKVSAADVQKLETLRAEMARQQIPFEKEARQAFEQRVKFSREPLGLFALANSFAGLLIVMGLIVAGLVGRSSRESWLACAMFAALIAYCLLLTKSRTAWVGLSIGVGWWMLRWVAARWGRSESSEHQGAWLRTGAWVLIGACVVGIAVGVAALSGGLDQAVVLEAPKSLRYRLEWWQGTWATIREHFWFGTGPGNFRDYYLAHKLPESSEEIADPHNFLFDVWANAGTFGLIGMLACAGLMMGQVFNLPGQKWNKDGQVENLPHETTWLSPAVWGVGLAFPLSVLGMEFVGHGTDERLWWLGGIWWVLWLIGVVWSRRRGCSNEATPADVDLLLPLALEGANVALMVHLLGAGGIAMPATTQLLWLVWGLRTACRESPVGMQVEKTPSESARRGVLAGQFSAAGCTLFAAVLSVVCLLTATKPELECRSSVQAGDYECGRRQIELAQAAYLDAVEADPWAIQPQERLAILGLQRWQQTQVDANFGVTVRLFQAVIDRLPFASRSHRELGQAWLTRFNNSHSPDHARRAAESFAAAVERYPHHAALLSEWAVACEGAGLSDAAREAARRAIRQDDINRQAGHSDKYLNADVRRRMERLAG